VQASASIRRNLFLLAAGMAALHGMVELAFGAATLTFEEVGGASSLAGLAPALLLGCAALAALHERVTRPDQPGARARRRAPDESQRWTPEDWELDRLDAFLTELRATAAPTGEAS